MPGVFISYRREDTGGAAGRLYDRLCAHFGSGCVFRDVDTIAPGDRFDRTIDERLAMADVVVALIGPEWVTSSDVHGRARLHEPRDFVRLEIATALRRDIPIIPALFGNARMPRADELPPDLAPLASRQAIEIDDPDFHEDVSRLIALLEPKVRRDASPVEPRRFRRAAAIGAGATAAAVLLIVATVAMGRIGFGPGGGPGPGDPGGSGSTMPTSAAGATGRGSNASSSSSPITLRSATTVLESSDVRAFIIGHGFFSSSNPAGTGIAHEYRQQVREGWPVVVDLATGLVWEHGGSGRIVQGGRAGAEAYVRALNEERAGGADAWRLPTLEEALSIVAPDPHEDLHLDPVFARGAPFIWTADQDPEGRSWVVYYLDAITSPERPEFNAYVRAVRSER